MTLDFTHGHAAGVERQNLVVKARPTGLVLRDDLRLKAAVAVTGNFYRQLAKVALEGFAALAVAGVARRVGNALILGVAQVFSHLGLKGSLHQFLGEQLEQAVLTDEVFRLLVVSQQVVDQFVRDGHLFAVPLKCSSSLPIDRLHKNSYTPTSRLCSMLIFPHQSTHCRVVNTEMCRNCRHGELARQIRARHRLVAIKTLLEIRQRLRQSTPLCAWYFV